MIVRFLQNKRYVVLFEAICHLFSKTQVTEPRQHRLNNQTISLSGATWAEQVARNERIRWQQQQQQQQQQHAAAPGQSPETQSNPALDDDHDDNSNILDDIHRYVEDQPSSSNPLDRNMSGITKWFGSPWTGHDACAKLPLERFLTATRAASTTYYERFLMQQMGMHDDFLDAMQRQSNAERNVAVTGSSDEQTSESAGSLDVEMEH